MTPSGATVLAGPEAPLEFSSEAPSWRQVTGRVRRQVAYGAGHFWLELGLPEPFARPGPGQFVQLLPSPSVGGTLLPRPMSVARVESDSSGLRLSFLYAPVGAGTLALAQLDAGAEVEVLGPLGRGFPLAHPGTPVLVAGGRGVAPLLFVADELASRGRSCEFLVGARDAERLVGLDDAERRCAGYGGRLHVCTDDGSRGAPGNVVALLDRLSPSFTPPLAIHACGPHAMLKSVVAWAAAHGVPAFVAMESVMACGTGVCRGCPLPRSRAGRLAFGNQVPSLLGSRDYAMCCTEGPVFDGAALDWERIA